MKEKETTDCGTQRKEEFTDGDAETGGPQKVRKMKRKRKTNKADGGQEQGRAANTEAGMEKGGDEV